MPSPTSVRGRGRSQRLDRPKIVAAALRLAQAGDLRELSMRRIAGALGVDVAALYWHFENKEDLVAEIAAAAAERFRLDLPGQGGWRRRARALCTAIRQRLREHPELALAGDQSPWIAPFNAHALGLLSGLLSQAGLGGRDAIQAGQMLLHEITALVQSQALGAAASPDAIRRYVRSVDQSLPEGLRADWRTLARRDPAEGFDEHFAWTVEALLDGIEARLRRTRKARPGGASAGP